MTTQRRQFLFTMWEGGGTVPPELGVARRLVDAGHRVHVLGDPTISASAQSIGCSFSPWERAPHRTSLDPEHDILKDWETTNPLVMMRRVRDRFIAGPAADFAADTAVAIERVQPDALVTDYLLFGSILAAQGAGVPVATLVPNIWMIPSRGTPSIGPGFGPAKTFLGRGRDAMMLRVTNRLFKGGLPALNAARAERGLERLTSFYDQTLQADRIFVLTNASFDYASGVVPSNVSYVGPILDEPDWVEPYTTSVLESSAHPIVLVGFSSTYQQQGPLLQRIVDALTTLPVRGIVTLGQMLDDDVVRSSANVAVVRSAPHGQILAEAALAISHCGHGTTMKTLAAGVPMVCLPMGRDQNDTVARVVHHGAGLRLSPNASVADIRAAVTKVFDNDSYRASAQRLAEAITSEQRTTNLIGELETVAGSPAGRTRTAVFRR